MLYLITFLCASIVSFWLIFPLRKFALKFNILDQPIGGVKTHRKPVPYLGGLAIFAGFILSLLMIRFITDFPTGTLRTLRAMFYGGTLIMLMGLIDDIRPLHFGIKLIVEIIASLIVIIGYDLRIQFVDSYWLSVILSLIWIVGITNALNIIDIMDGLSAGVAIINSLFFFFIALPSEQIYVNFASLALAGAALGFLIHNFPPAKIFMGDTGSGFLGFILATIALGENYTGVNILGLLSPIFILGIPIYDTILVMYFRLRKKQNPLKGSKDHFALRLKLMGYSHRKILGITYGISIVLGLAAYLLTILPSVWAIFVFLFVFIMGLVFANYLAIVEVE